MSASQGSQPAWALTATGLLTVLLGVGHYLNFGGTVIGSAVFAVVVMLVGLAALGTDDLNLLFRTIVPLTVLVFGLQGFALNVGWTGLGLTLVGIGLLSLLVELVMRRYRAARPSSEPPVDDVPALRVEAGPDLLQAASTVERARPSPVGGGPDADQPTESESSPAERRRPGARTRDVSRPKGPQEPSRAPAPEPVPEPDREPEVDVDALVRAVAEAAPIASAAELAQEAIDVLGFMADRSELEGAIRAAAAARFVEERRGAQVPEPAAPKTLARGGGRRSSGSESKASRGAAARGARPAPERTGRSASADSRDTGGTNITDAPRCYIVGRLWAIRITVDDGVLSSSSASIPPAFARHLEVAALDSARFTTAEGLELTVDRRGDQDVITGMLPLIEELGLQVGDEVLIIAPAWRGRPLTVRPLLRADLSSLRPAQQATRRMGLTSRSAASALPLSVGLPRTASITEVVDALSRRGETDLAEALRDDRVPFHLPTETPSAAPAAPTPSRGRERRPGPRTPDAERPSVPSEGTAEEDRNGVESRSSTRGAAKRTSRDPATPSRSSPSRARSGAGRRSGHEAADEERHEAPGVADIADILGL